MLINLLIMSKFCQYYLMNSKNKITYKKNCYIDVNKSASSMLLSLIEVLYLTWEFYCAGSLFSKNYVIFDSYMYMYMYEQTIFHIDWCFQSILSLKY